MSRLFVNASLDLNPRLLNWSTRGDFKVTKKEKKVLIKIIRLLEKSSIDNVEIRFTRGEENNNAKI